MKIRVAVIYGGRSGEHEISLRSAESIMKAMDRSKYEIAEYFISKEGNCRPSPILPEPGAHPDIDVVFPVLHGTFGEDGTVQGLLELADLPYVGAGVLGSSLSMDKEMMKRVCHERGLPVVEYLTLARGCMDTDDIVARLPISGVRQTRESGARRWEFFWQRDRAELEKALALAAEYDRKIIVAGIEGREFECPCWAMRIPSVIALRSFSSREFYDYEDKYLLDKAKFQLPADLPAEKTAELRRLAVGCYQAVEARGWRASISRWSTRPAGVHQRDQYSRFTSISMYPKMWSRAVWLTPSRSTA